eukprot:1984570-Prymnesium_polylepis.1
MEPAARPVYALKAARVVAALLDTFVRQALLPPASFADGGVAALTGSTRLTAWREVNQATGTQRVASPPLLVVVQIERH